MKREIARELSKKGFDTDIPQKDSLTMVAEFHQVFDHPVQPKPALDDVKTNTLRMKLLLEEMGELSDALEQKDPVAVLDALCDIQYVLDGAFLALGYANVKSCAMMEVHRSNMSKADEDGNPIHASDGKVVKGPNYSPPCLDIFLN